MKRYALVRNADSREQAERYLPDNYRLVHEVTDRWYPRDAGGNVYEKPPRLRDGEPVAETAFVVEGEDFAGWTLHGYVIPRYASGLIWAEEIDLSHPAMKEVPLNA